MCRVKSEENVADLRAKPLSKAVIAKHCLPLGCVNMAMFWDFGSIHMTVRGGRTVDAQNTAGDPCQDEFTCSQKQQQRKQQWQHTTIAQDEFGGHLHVAPRGRVHWAITKENQCKKAVGVISQILKYSMFPHAVDHFLRLLAEWVGCAICVKSAFNASRFGCVSN